MTPTLSTAYLPPIEYFLYMVSCPYVNIELCDNYVKQTYRNRCFIAGAGGIQTLTVPVVRTSRHQKVRDVAISSHGDWTHVHWNALESAYMNSPYYVYYKDEFLSIYKNPPKLLGDFNMELTLLICKLIGIECHLEPTVEYISSPEFDLRYLSEPAHKEKNNSYEPYYQVFKQKNGFIGGLSIVDLLFNLGPESLIYLKKNTYIR